MCFFLLVDLFVVVAVTLAVSVALFVSATGRATVTVVVVFLGGLPIFLGCWVWVSEAIVWSEAVEVVAISLYKIRY